MTITGVKNEVLRKFYVGQELTLKIKDDESKGKSKIDVKILGFNENSVLTERYGYKVSIGKNNRYTFKESYRYLEFLMMSTRLIEEKPITQGRAKRKNVGTFVY